MCWNKGRLCWKIAKLFYFCHLKKLVRPETVGPYYVYNNMHSQTRQNYKTDRATHTTRHTSDVAHTHTHPIIRKTEFHQLRFVSRLHNNELPRQVRTYSEHPFACWRCVITFADTRLIVKTDNFARRNESTKLYLPVQPLAAYIEKVRLLTRSSSAHT